MSTLSWKLVPFVALVALGVFALAPGAGVPSANADVNSLSLSADFFTSGDEITVTVNLSASDDDITVAATGTTPDETLAVTDCNPNCPDEDGSEEGASVTIATDDITQVTLSLTATCTSVTTITIDVDQGSSSDDDTVECRPEPNVTIRKELTTGAATTDFNFTISGTSTECDDTFVLSDGESAGYGCDSPGTYTITEAALTGFALTAIDCDSSGVPSSDITRDVATRTLTITLGGGSDSVDCTFTNNTAGTATPTVTTTPSGATGVTVSAAPSTVNCSGSSFITVVVKSGTANVADGTTVSVTTTSGSLSPTSAPTSGGGILTIFTAGSSSGTATITASAGGQTGTTTVTVNCGAPTAVPTSPPPPPPVQTVAPGGGIRPPNTGDAGLVADGGTNWMIVGIVAVIATSAAGGLVLARRRF